MAATPQDYIANWIGGISSNERIGYIKRLIDTCPLEDIKPLKNVLVNTAKRKSPFPRNYAKKIRLGQINVEASTSSTPNEVVPKSSPEVLVSTDVGMDVSNQLQAEQFWWKSYKKEDIVALDCEMVSIKMPQGQRNKMTAATVSVVDFNGKEIYCAKVYHKTGTFIVNKHTLVINGFNADSLEDGEKFDTVRNKLMQLLDGKLIVTCNGSSDYNCLDIPSGDLDLFEFHHVWVKWNGEFTKSGEKVYQPISLKRLYKHYFGGQIQQGNHTAYADAAATMQLFKQAYIPWAEIHSPLIKYPVPIGYFDNIE